MTKIEEFLTKFDDQHLANLQAAAEDGRLLYHDACNCLVHHFAGDYSMTKWQSSPISQLAREAEFEFMEMGMGMPCLERDVHRCERVLAMIHAEWSRRAKERIPERVEAMVAG